MTPPIIPPKDRISDSTVSEIHALYREGAGAAEPGPGLDRAILEAARTELRADKTAKSRRQTPWWKRWIPATTAIAVAVVGLSLTLHVSELREGDLSAVIGAMEPKRDDANMGAEKATGNATLAERPAETRAAGNAQTAKPSQNAASSAARDFSPVVRERATSPAPSAERRALPASQESNRGGTSQAPAAMAQPLPASEALNRSPPIDVPERLKKSESDASAPAVRLEAEQYGAGSRAARAADSIGPAASRLPDDAPTPEAWLKLIREQRAAGRNTEAMQSLARFRARYPDFVLPADLIQPK